MIVLRSPKGWTGPERGRRQAGRGLLALAPGAVRRRPQRRRPPGGARGVAAQLPARGALRRSAAPRCRTIARPAPGRRPADEREPARQRRDCCCATCGCPTSATTPSTVDAPGTGAVEATRVLGTFLRDVMARNMDNVPAVLARTRTAPTGSRTSWRSPTGPGTPRRMPDDDHLAARRPDHGDPLRAHLPGLAGGLPAHRPARVVLLLRGVHPRRRLDVQPARQVAEDHQRHPVAAADRRR